ncbi:hypothetical protein QQX98_010780 [Neonectria punicea]|uniref:Mitochondrial carrier protein pet8 n=1 Tax=Neonectria punicea TaxID=979145 RepID=A0ABR1GNX6_9HYPO
MMSARTMLAMRPMRVGSVMAGRGFTMSTSARLGLKESSSQTDTDYDHHKKDSLAKQKAGEAHWKPELASDSEEALRADRAAQKGPEAMGNLQERTKRAAEERAKKGTSTKDDIEG